MNTSKILLNTSKILLNTSKILLNTSKIYDIQTDHSTCPFVYRPSNVSHLKTHKQVTREL